MCKLAPETEQHFMLQCPAYTNSRKLLFQEISELDQNVYRIPNGDRLAYLMSTTSEEVLRKIIFYIYNIFKQRKELLSN